MKLHATCKDLMSTCMIWTVCPKYSCLTVTCGNFLDGWNLASLSHYEMWRLPMIKGTWHLGIHTSECHVQNSTYCKFLMYIQ